MWGGGGAPFHTLCFLLDEDLGVCITPLNHVLVELGQKHVEKMCRRSLGSLANVFVGPLFCKGLSVSVDSSNPNASIRCACNHPRPQPRRLLAYADLWLVL